MSNSIDKHNPDQKDKNRVNYNNLLKEETNCQIFEELTSQDKNRENRTN